MTLKLTEEELCEAVESYWGRRKTGKPVLVKQLTHFNVKDSTPDSSFENSRDLIYIFEYENLNP